LVSPSVVLIEVNSELDSFLPTGGLGSGFVYDTEGHIITNYHVVNGASRIDVTFFDGRLARAEVVGMDADSDLAVIQVQDIDPATLKPLALGDSSALRVGEGVIAIGNPFGQSWTMTEGIVSALGRSNPSETGFSIPQMIQTDAAINPGNSGGPLLNLQGQVIGITTMIFTETQGSSGVGFAVPSATIGRVVPELITNGDYDYTWIGISGGNLNLDVIELMNLDSSVRGVLVDRISQNSPAEVAGLRGNNDTDELNGVNYDIGGDIVTAINGQSVTSMDDLVTFLAEQTRPGDTIEVTVIRDGSPVIILVRLEARPTNPR
jgi:S1-C subfamily serine protease